MSRKRLKLWPNDWIVHHDKAACSSQGAVKQFLAQKSITEMEHPPYPHLSPKDFWLFPKIVCLKGRKISGY
jgi:hypothetical protein